jgi:hypothetical protein
MVTEFDANHVLKVTNIYHFITFTTFDANHVLIVTKVDQILVNSKVFVQYSVN